MYDRNEMIGEGRRGKIGIQNLLTIIFLIRTYLTGCTLPRHNWFLGDPVL